MTWVASLWSSSSFWETMEYLAEATVIVGATFELLAGFEYIYKGDENKERRKRIEKNAAITLIIGLVVSLGALIRTNYLFNHQDRHITSAQREQMLSILKESPGARVMVTYLFNGDNDAQEYAIEIASVFRDAPRWTVVSPPPGVSSDEPVYGFAIQAQNNSAVSKLPLIERVLSVTGYNVIRWPLKPGPDEIDIYVGRK
jgi:hypothetical protein